MLCPHGSADKQQFKKLHVFGTDRGAPMVHRSTGKVRSGPVVADARPCGGISALIGAIQLNHDRAAHVALQYLQAFATPSAPPTLGPGHSGKIADSRDAIRTDLPCCELTN
jgi:hypothetical protein